MIILDCEQRSPEWFEARHGIPTASCASKIVTSTGKPSAQQRAYMLELLAERRGHVAEPMEPTEWMQRGIELESEAVSVFEVDQLVSVDAVGMCMTDDKRASCSPDGLLSPHFPADRGIGLEIKCPKPSTHMGYLLDGKLPAAYKPQVHMSMAVTGYSHWWFMSYLPNEKPLYLLVERDTYTDQVREHLNTFINKLEKAEEKLK